MATSDTFPIILGTARAARRLAGVSSLMSCLLVSWLRLTAATAPRCCSLRATRNSAIF